MSTQKKPGPATPGCAVNLESALAAHFLAQFPRWHARLLLRSGSAQLIAQAYERMPTLEVVSFQGLTGEAARTLLSESWRFNGEAVLPHLANVLAAPPERQRDAPTHSGELPLPPVQVRVIRQPIRPITDDSVDAVEMYRKALDAALPVSRIPQPNVLAGLAARFPWFRDVISAVRSELLIAQRLQAIRVSIPPLLLIGPPGIGKSRFAAELAVALDRPSFVQPMNALHEGFSISGSPRTYHRADASLVVRVMAQTRRADPIIILDELDKCGSSDWNVRADLALLPWVDRSATNGALDMLLGVPVDASYVTWIATANDATKLSAPLRSRFHEVQCCRPDASALDELVVSFAAELSKRYAVAPSAIPLPEGASRERLARELERSGDIREVESAWRKWLARRLCVDATALPSDGPF